MASEGLPIPNIPIAEAEKDSAFSRFLAALTSLFSAKAEQIAGIINANKKMIAERTESRRVSA